MINERIYDKFKCTFEYKSKAKVLVIQYFKKEKLCFRSCVMNATKTFSNQFICQFDEKMAKEVYYHNIEII